MKFKIIGSWLILFGIISLFATIYLFPPEGIAGSYSAPYTAERMQSSFYMQTMAETLDEEREFYIETNSITFATQSTSNDVIPMTFKEGTHYKQSYIYKDTLTPSEYINLISMKHVVGIWDIPDIMLINDMYSSNVDAYGNIQDALEHSGVTDLVSMGASGNNTITVVIDGFPTQSEFYNYYPIDWSDRILNYPSSTSGSLHGVMTSSVVAGVSPYTKLYLLDLSEIDILSIYQTVIDLKNIYPNYNIICTNSYVFGGSVYYDSSHPLNRKILEMTDNNVTVLFGAGNWAHPGDHNPSWTLDVGYDSRNINYGSNDQIGYPAVFDRIISVAGCNAFCNKIVSYSSKGVGLGGNYQPDVSAPTHFYYEYSPYNGIASGTSTSCPFMAGVVANILSVKDVDVERMVGSIRSYSLDKGEKGFDTSFGYGVVDAVNIYNNYDNWIKPINESLDLSMYIMSISLLGLGAVVYNKDNIEKKLKF